MRRFRRLPALMWIVVVVGCGSSNVPQTAQPEPEGRGTYRIASDGASPPVTASATSAVPAPYDGPPHLFTPESHPPVYRYRDFAAVDLGSLPRFKMRFDKCFREDEKRRPIPLAKPTKPRRGGKKAPGKQRRQSTRRPKSKGAAASSPVLGTSPAGEALGAVAGDMGGSAPPPGAAPVTPPPMVRVPAGDKAAASESAPVPPRAEEAEASSERSRESNKRIAADDVDADVSVIVEDEPAPPPETQYDDWGRAVYFSNDDTMSLSSAQRVMYAIDRFLPLPAEHIRPHELLNYFSFNTSPVTDGYDFSVNGEIAPDPREAGIYTLGLAVKGRPVDKASRRNAAITLVIDRSGSMSDEGRMSYLKQGLHRMIDELKTGDMVHLVIFDHEVCVPAENFVVGRDNVAKLKKVIDALEPRGSTDLHMGLSKGYDIADRAYQDKYSNRVVMITDAIANTGVTDETMISMISKYYDTRRIRLSGVGVGRNFNDALLDRLTERGKGAYVFLGSEAEVDAVFGPRFISLIETTALNVHFRLHLPPSLRMNVFYGEESSFVKSDVQEIHYFANTSQLFLADLMARGGKLRPEDGIMLSAEYEDPETGAKLKEEYAFTLEDLSLRSRNVKKARVIMAWIDMLAEMADRTLPPATYYHRRTPGSWPDPGGWARCEDGRKELKRLSEAVLDDPEIQRVVDLWEKYCARYERPRNPVKRRIAVPDDSWPGATDRRR